MALYPASLAARLLLSQRAREDVPEQQINGFAADPKVLAAELGGTRTLSKKARGALYEDPEYLRAQEKISLGTAEHPYGKSAGAVGAFAQGMQEWVGQRDAKAIEGRYAQDEAAKREALSKALGGYMAPGGGIGGGAGDQQMSAQDSELLSLALSDPDNADALLGNLIQQRFAPKEAPEYETVNADGKVMRINKRDPNDRVEIGAQDVKKKISRVEMVGPDGPGVYNVDDTTGEVIGKVGGIYNKPPSSVVNVNNSAEGAYQKKRGEDWATNAGEIYRAAQDAPTNIGRYDRFEALVTSGIPTGKVSEMTLPARQALKELGIADDATISGQEEISALAANFTLTQLAALKGASSDRDLSWAAQSVANLGNTPEGNIEKIRIGRKAEQRKMEVARLAAEYEARNGQLDAGFQMELNRYAEQNPMFSEGDRQRIDAIAKRRAGGPSATKPTKPASDPLGLFE